MARPIWRKDFDSRYEFVAIRPLRFAEGTVLVGERLDKAAVPTRRLRQLYDARMIDIAGTPLVVAEPSPPPMPESPGDVVPPSPPAAEGGPRDVDLGPLPVGWRTSSSTAAKALAARFTGIDAPTRLAALAALDGYDRGRAT